MDRLISASMHRQILYGKLPICMEGGKVEIDLFTLGTSLYDDNTLDIWSGHHELAVHISCG
jgi:hypothetical protein